MRRPFFLTQLAVAVALAACSAVSSSSPEDGSQRPRATVTAPAAAPTATPTNPSTLIPPAAQALLDKAKAASRERYLFAID